MVFLTLTLHEHNDASSSKSQLLRVGKPSHDSGELPCSNMTAHHVDTAVYLIAFLWVGFEGGRGVPIGCLNPECGTCEQNRLDSSAKDSGRGGKNMS